MSEVALLEGLLAGAKGLLNLGLGCLRGYASRNNRRDSKEKGKSHVGFSKSRAKRGEILRYATRRTKNVRKKRPGRSAQDDRGEGLRDETGQSSRGFLQATHTKENFKRGIRERELEITKMSEPGGEAARL